MKPIQLISVVKNGRLSPPVADRIRKFLAEMEGKTVAIAMERKRRKRSNPQNAFYWGVVLPIAVSMFAEAGENADRDTVHRYLKGEVGGMKKPVTSPDGEVIWRVDTSTRLTTMEWEDWMTKIRAWAAAFGVEMPLPNEPRQEAA